MGGCFKVGNPGDNGGCDCPGGGTPCGTLTVTLAATCSGSSIDLTGIDITWTPASGDPITTATNGSRQAVFDLFGCGAGTLTATSPDPRLVDLSFPVTITCPCGTASVTPAFGLADGYVCGKSGCEPSSCYPDGGPPFPAVSFPATIHFDDGIGTIDCAWNGSTTGPEWTGCTTRTAAKAYRCSSGTTVLDDDATVAVYCTITCAGLSLANPGQYIWALAIPCGVDCGDAACAPCGSGRGPSCQSFTLGCDYPGEFSSCAGFPCNVYQASDEFTSGSCLPSVSGDGTVTLDETFGNVGFAFSTIYGAEINWAIST
jgi:hypothetical protein